MKILLCNNQITRKKREQGITVPIRFKCIINNNVDIPVWTGDTTLRN